MKKKNTFLKVILWIVAIILLIVIILQFAASGIVTKTANKFLGEKGNIGKISISILNGSVNVKDVTLKQPEGYENNKLLQLDKLSAKVRYFPLLRGKVVVSYVKVTNLNIDIQKIDEDINLLSFADSLSGDVQVSTEKSASSQPPEIFIKSIKLNNVSVSFQETSDGIVSQSAKVEGINTEVNRISSKGLKNIVEQVAFSLEKADVTQNGENGKQTQIIVNNLMINTHDIEAEDTHVQIPEIKIEQDSMYVKDVTAGKTATISMTDFALQIKNMQALGEDISIEEVSSDSFKVSAGLPENIVFNLKDLVLFCKDINFTEKADAEPAEIIFNGKIVNEEHGDNHLGFYALVRDLAADFPTINAVLTIIGLELEPMKSMIPPGTYQALGGDAFDLNATLSASEMQLDCEINIDMIQGTKLGMKIGGTPEKPELDTSSVLFNVFSRFGGGIGSGLSKVGGTTLGAAKTGVTTALGVGKGAKNVVSSVGKGVFKSVKGVVTLDAKEIGEGLKTTTVGTVKEAGKTVLDTGNNLLEGSGDALKNVSGNTAASKWRQEKQKRLNETWEKAKEKVKK